MPRRLLVRLFARLDRSPLRMTDPVRLALERELIELLVEDDRHAQPLVNVAVVGSA